MPPSTRKDRPLLSVNGSSLRKRLSSLASFPAPIVVTHPDDNPSHTEPRSPTLLTRRKRERQSTVPADNSQSPPNPQKQNRPTFSFRLSLPSPQFQRSTVPQTLVSLTPASEPSSPTESLLSPAESLLSPLSPTESVLSPFSQTLTFGLASPSPFSPAPSPGSTPHALTLPIPHSPTPNPITLPWPAPTQNPPSTSTLVSPTTAQTPRVVTRNQNNPFPRLRGSSPSPSPTRHPSSSPSRHPSSSPSRLDPSPSRRQQTSNSNSPAPQNVRTVTRGRLRPNPNSTIGYTYFCRALPYDAGHQPGCYVVYEGEAKRRDVQVDARERGRLRREERIDEASRPDEEGGRERDSTRRRASRLGRRRSDDFGSALERLPEFWLSPPTNKSRSTNTNARVVVSSLPSRGLGEHEGVALPEEEDGKGRRDCPPSYWSLYPDMSSLPLSSPAPLLLPSPSQAETSITSSPAPALRLPSPSPGAATPSPSYVRRRLSSLSSVFAFSFSAGHGKRAIEH